VVATPHIYRHKTINPETLNNKNKILERIEEFKAKLAESGIDLEILPGCDVPLCLESLDLLNEDLVLSINDNKRYLLLELPDTSIPPATEEVCFYLISKGMTPIITHPERHFIIQQMPGKLTRLLELGCLAQVTASSLLGGFGRQVAKFARYLVRKNYIHVVASDAHNTRSRPPRLGAAREVLVNLLGTARAWDMVHTIPEKIVRGEPYNF
jgi:protein-tyrosine phosphatase